VRNGKAMCAPLSVDIRTYPVRIEEGQVYIELEDA
jgi:naphthalene 1,2-dioxygenase system ferredoxin subunit